MHIYSIRCLVALFILLLLSLLPKGPRTFGFYGYNGNKRSRTSIHHHIWQEKPILFVQPRITNRQRVSVTCYRADAH